MCTSLSAAAARHALRTLTGVEARTRGHLLGGAGALAAAGVVEAVGPGGGGYPACPFLATTGRPCPLCGGLRAVHELTRADLAAAVSLNLMVVVLVALVAVDWTVRLRGRSVPRWAYALVAGAFVVFWVVRNLPFGAALAP